MPEKVASVRARAELAPGVWLIDCAMREPKTLPFRAGQFVSIRIDDGGTRRSYSIASSPQRQDGFELLVKLVPGGVGSRYFEGLAPGGEVHFTGAMGFFVLDLQHPGDVVFAATGSGIAAALPMAAEALARPEPGRVILYWGLRREEDLYFQDRVAALAGPRFEPRMCLSQPSAAWTGARGRITPHVLARLPSLDRPVVYAVGHGDMVREVKEGLVALGLDRKKQFRQEVFYPETPR